jgi:hypothetical protein
MMTMSSAQIQENLAEVQRRIASAAAQAGRPASAIALLAVSKTRTAAEVLAAYRAGQLAFGENYVKEALDKISALSDLPLEWHYIGAIQSNKTRLIAEHFSWVHTLASLKHAKRLDAQRSRDQPPLNVCIQVNTSHEESKGGIAAAELPTLAREVMRCGALRLRGLMALPAPVDDYAQQRQNFSQLRRLKEQLQQQGIELDTLSMGMSADLEAAIAEGATIVRIGTAIFGPRNPVANRA